MPRGKALAAWVRQASEQIRELLDDQLALVEPEVTARLCEPAKSYGQDVPQPHIVSRALEHLTSSGEIIKSQTTTRGSRPITTYTPADDRLRRTKIQRAAARKRLLYGRYLSWTEATSEHPQGLLGPATERAAVAGIQAAQVLQAPPDSAGREVGSFLGVTFSGPVDYIGMFTPIQARQLGAPIVVLVEIKGNRGWVYPHGAEIFQPLAKAVQFGEEHPAQPCVPILITRHVHPNVFRLAVSIGMMVIPMQAQFVGPTVDSRLLQEVRTELGFRDVYGGPDEPGVSLRVQRYLSSPEFRRAIPAAADRWAQTLQSTSATNAIKAGWRGRNNATARTRAGTHLERALKSSARDPRN